MSFFAGMKQSSKQDFTKQTNTWTHSKPTCLSACEGVGDCLKAQHHVEHAVTKPSSMEPKTPTTSDAAANGLPKSSPRSQDFTEHIGHSQEYESQKGLLLSVAKFNNGFLEPTARRAIEFMLYIGQSSVIIDLVAAYIYIVVGHIPTGAEVFKTMMEYDFQENAIVKLIDEYVKTAEGASALKSALKSSSMDEPEVRESNGVNGAQNSMPDSEDSGSVDSLERTIPNDARAKNEQSPQEKPLIPENRMSHAEMAKTLVEIENAKLKNKLMCRMCKQRPISVTLLPCGHFVLCNICSEPCRVCPCCQRVVLAEKKTYLC